MKDNENANKQQYNDDKWWHFPVAGILSGIGGGYTCYPFEGWKKRKQSGQQQPKISQIKEIYRGSSAFALSLGPVSMVQVSVNNWLQKKIIDEKSPPYLKNMIGIFSGSLGAFVSAPVEHIILTQQKYKVGTFSAIKLLTKHGYYYPWTGLKPLLVREAGFGFTMLMGTEIAGKWLSDKFQKDLTFLGSIMVGLFGAAITHPFDVIATKKQVASTPISMINAGKEIFADRGLKGFFAGYAYRALLFTGCAIVIGYLNRTIQENLKNPKVSDNKFSLFSQQSISNEKKEKNLSDQENITKNEPKK